LITPENGWQVAFGNEGELLEALSDALSDPRKLRQMGFASYKRVKNFINVDRMADVFIEALIFAQNQVGIKRS